MDFAWLYLSLNEDLYQRDLDQVLGSRIFSRRSTLGSPGQRFVGLQDLTPIFDPIFLC